MFLEGFFIFGNSKSKKMKPGFLYLLLFFLAFQLKAQDPDADYTWWNELHDWHDGDPGWRNWMKITPGYLGPNALPIPDVKRGVLSSEVEFQVSAAAHFLAGDPTQDLSGRFYYPFAANKIAVEVYGVAVEHFAFSEEIRNQRFARIEDGKGFAVGDFYFSTLIQISKNRKFPNTLLRFTTRTASGNKLEGARFSDSPGYFFDLSTSKEYGSINRGIFRPFALFGFYSWQTNDELNLQNDAFMYAAGFDLEKNNWLFSTSLAGYSGYKHRLDRPQKINFEIKKDFKTKAIKLEYYHGTRHWRYKTVKLSFIWKFKPINEQVL